MAPQIAFVLLRGSSATVGGGLYSRRGGELSPRIPAQRRGDSEGTSVVEDGPGSRRVQDPHPHGNWVRHGEASVLAWPGDASHEQAADGSRWAASRKGFVAWCARQRRTPALRR